MSELVHEGKKYEAKDIPGFGLSFVPVKETDIWDELTKTVEFYNAPIHNFKEVGFNMKLVYDPSTTLWNFIIIGPSAVNQIRNGFRWGTLKKLFEQAKEHKVTYEGEDK